ncbi:MAG: PEP-CTERM/exosortase system-associated acyltransferase [Stellaceae bacterium]
MEAPAQTAAVAECPTAKPTLVEFYQTLFESVPADTPELQRAAHRLRYQVYCVEHHYEDPSANPGGLERDEYDDHAVHGILRHRPSGMIVGTVRVVLHAPGARVGSLPIHRVCQDERMRDPTLLPIARTAELSRFAVSKSFRRRVGDGVYGRAEDAEATRHDPRRMIPHITLGLMSVALRMMVERSIETTCAVMEPALLRMLARLGIHFNVLGPPVLYHGWRQPCYVKLVQLLARMKSERPDIWEVITDRGRFVPRIERGARVPLEGAAV